MPGDASGTRSAHASTVLLWALAIVLAIVGMALDARGSFALSLACFLAASAALVAPLEMRRRRDTTGSDRRGS